MRKGGKWILRRRPDGFYIQGDDSTRGRRSRSGVPRPGLQMPERRSGQPIDDWLTQRLNAEHKLVFDFIARASREATRLNDAVEELRRLRASSGRLAALPAAKGQLRWGCRERPLPQINGRGLSRSSGKRPASSPSVAQSRHATRQTCASWRSYSAFVKTPLDLVHQWVA